MAHIRSRIVSLVSTVLVAASLHAAAADSIGTATPKQAQPPASAEMLRAPAGSIPATTLVVAPAANAAIQEAKRANAAATLKRLAVGLGRDVGDAAAARLESLAWRAVPGGFVAHLRVMSAGAHALRIGVAAAILPAATQLRFVGFASPDTVYGPYLAGELAMRGDPTFWSPVLEGDTALVELFALSASPPSATGKLVTQVSHLFASPVEGEAAALPKVGESGFCEVDFACLANGNTGLAQTGSAVARMTFTDGSGQTFLCSGTQLNAIGGQFKPYFYTANHCISSQSLANTLTTHWFYQRSGCGSGSTDSRYAQVTGGANLLYANHSSDVSFMCLNKAAPGGTSFAGWDAGAVTPGLAATAIHHPAGDWKKVSLGSTGAAGAYPGGDPSGSFTVVNWNSISTGVTEGGSSGSGIFTLAGGSPSDFRLRGGLLGGPSSCTASTADLHDYYSRLDVAYPNISQYLNPSDTSACSVAFASASASVPGAGGTFTVTITGGTCCPWSVTSNAAWITTSSLGSGPGTVTYVVAPNTGTSPRSATISLGSQAFTVSQAAGGTTAPGGNILANPGFESGGSSWTQSSTGGFSVFYTDGQHSHGGSGYAWLGGYTGGTDVISQDVQIPSGAASATLQFWYLIGTQEITTTQAYDVMQVSVQDLTAGGARNILVSLSNLNAGSWTQSAAYDLSAYRGHTVRIAFSATTDSTFNTNFFIDDVSLTTSASGGGGGVTNYSDIWWNPNENGWGVTIADHQSQMFVIWYTYRITGHSMWYSIPGGTFTQNRRFFTGDLYQTSGPPYTGNFDPAQVTVTRVGTANFDLNPPNLAPGHILFTYSVNGITVTKELQRLAFGSAAPNWGIDYTDLWWDSAESGWGLALAQHGNNIFGILYIYDTDGQPLFVSLPGVTFNGSNTFTGTLYTTTGPYFGNSFYDPSQVQVTPVGSATVSFNGRTATVSRTINGSTQSRSVAQLEFGDTGPTGNGGPLEFSAPAPGPATQNQPYSFCYCSPAPANINDLCGSPTQGNPSGGNPPYHFQLQTAGGFPPIGIVLNPNGCLSGTPTAQGTSNFGVCAVDLSANFVCEPSSVTVGPPQPTGGGGGFAGTWAGTWTRHFGGFGDGTFTLTWQLTQNGGSAGGSYSWVETGCDGLCPDPVGATGGDSFVAGTINGSTVSLTAGGGTTFAGTLSGNTISGSSGGSFPGTFTLNRQ